MACISSKACRGVTARAARPVGARVAVPTLRRGLVIAAATVDKAKVLEEVQGIISTQLGADLAKVSADAKFVDLGADSLDTVEIMMALEEKFDITLDEEGAEKISTVQDAADMIATQIAAK